MAPNDFKLLLERLDPDETKAAKKYRNLRDKLVRHCFRGDEFLRADELADEALAILARKLAPEDIRKLEDYAFKVLNKLLANHRRSRPRIPLSEDIPSPDNPEHTVIKKIDGARKVDCFLQCVRQLSPTERWLLFAYHPDEECNVEERRRQIAIKLGITPGALTTRMNRLRAKVEKCCKDCFNRGSSGAPRDSNGAG